MAGGNLSYKCIVVVHVCCDMEEEGGSFYWEEFSREADLPFVPQSEMLLNFGLPTCGPLIVRFATWHHELSLFTVALADIDCDKESHRDESIEWLTSTCGFRHVPDDEKLPADAYSVLDNGETQGVTSGLIMATVYKLLDALTAHQKKRKPSKRKGLVRRS